jgi:hypothetical protein
MKKKSPFTETEITELAGLRVKTLHRWTYLSKARGLCGLGRCVRCGGSRFYGLPPIRTAPQRRHEKQNETFRRNRGERIAS